MQPDLETYFAIDRRRKGWIAYIELDQYAIAQGLGQSFTQEWKRRFDPNNTRQITVLRICESLNLDPAHVTEQYPLTETDLSDITVIQSDMATEMQRNVIGVLDIAMLQHPDQEGVWIQFMKRELDGQFGRIWHVILVHGQYHSFYSHEGGCNFSFLKDNRIFIVYRTPNISQNLR